MGEKPAASCVVTASPRPGASVEEATLTAIKLNEVAEINYRASLLGTPEPISQEDIDVLAGQGSAAKAKRCTPLLPGATTASCWANSLFILDRAKPWLRPF